MEKTFSQKIARFMEVSCYFLLIPATLKVLSVLPLMFATFFGFLVFLGIYLIGCVLLYDYHRHARQKLNLTNLVVLWTVTLIFNGFGAWWLLANSNIYGAELNNSRTFILGMELTDSITYILWNSFILISIGWYLLVCVLSIAALRCDLKQSVAKHNLK